MPSLTLSGGMPSLPLPLPTLSGGMPSLPLPLPTFQTGKTLAYVVV